MVFTFTKAMAKLRKQLIEQKGITESSADAYLRLLVQLNNKNGFTNLLFLRDVKAVEGKLMSYAISTRKNYVSAICSVLSLNKGKQYKKLYDEYLDMLDDLRDMAEEERGDTKVKTEKEKTNWIDWNDVESKRNALEEKVKEFADNKTITAEQYELLQAYLLLCLYTYLPPRRNADFQKMVVVRQWTEHMPTNQNYLDLYGQRFIFNVYKTAKHHGQQILEIPEEGPLREAIVLYLKHNPGYKSSKNKSVEFPFLLKHDGTPMTSVNAITRILNRIFGKRVGVSMLRHSYLSKKYGKVMEDMEEDGMAMAHSSNIQKSYIRTDDTDEKEEEE
jgi:hypothetical protein